MLALGLAVALPAWAGAPILKHSGTVVAVDQRAGTIVLAEVGPWRVRQGRTEVTHRTIVVRPETTVTLVMRADDAPSGFPGDFVAVALDPWDLEVGDFATVECQHEGRRLIGLRITLTVPEAP